MKFKKSIQILRPSGSWFIDPSILDRIVYNYDLTTKAKINQCIQ